MNVSAIFQEHSKEIISAWIDIVHSTYHFDTKGFLRTKKDRFCNPVGEMTETVAKYLYDAVAGEPIDVTVVSGKLERFVKLRSVQDFSPSQGIGILYLMKPIMRTKLMPLFVAANKLDDYLEAESRLDTLALMAFDIYISTRETLAEMRIKEIRDQHAQIVRWAQNVEGKSL